MRAPGGTAVTLPRRTLGVVIVSLLVGLGIFFALSRTARGFALALVCFALAGGAAWLRRTPRFKMQLAVTARGLAWVHAEHGRGALQWKEVGAISIHRKGMDNSLSVCLVPKERSMDEGFVLSTADFGTGVEDGQVRLREFVKQVLPLLPAEVVIDRGTRKQLAEWQSNL